MSSLPRVTDTTRERVTREFDDLGPDACVAQITEDLKANNPELLEMANVRARAIGESARALTGFCMFYRLLTAQWALELSQVRTEPSFSPLPHVTRATRDRVMKELEARGSEAFTMDHIDELERHNPGLLQMAHNFASNQRDYLGVMQGFALLWAALIAQSVADRTYLQ